MRTYLQETRQGTRICCAAISQPRLDQRALRVGTAGRGHSYHSLRSAKIKPRCRCFRGRWGSCQPRCSGNDFAAVLDWRWKGCLFRRSRARHLSRADLFQPSSRRPSCSSPSCVISSSSPGEPETSLQRCRSIFPTHPPILPLRDLDQALLLFCLEPSGIIPIKKLLE